MFADYRVPQILEARGVLEYRQQQKVSKVRSMVAFSGKAKALCELSKIYTIY
jgi:hypothetical protein